MRTLKTLVTRLGRLTKFRSVHAQDGELMALIERQLTQHEAAAWLRHLAACPTCKQRCARLKAAVNQVSPLKSPGLSTERLLAIRSVVRNAATSTVFARRRTRMREGVSRCLGSGIAARGFPQMGSPDVDAAASMLPIVETLLGRRMAAGWAKFVVPAQASFQG